MHRRRILAIAATASALPLGTTACGDEGSSALTLPAMITTTSTVVVVETTIAMTTETYVVRAGDRLGNIARKFGVSLQDLMTLNGITNADLIQIDQSLKIPSRTISSSLPPTSGGSSTPPTTA